MSPAQKSRYDSSLGTVHITARSRSGPVVPPTVADLIPTNVARIAHDPIDQKPCDYYLVSSLNASVEREAARLGALPVCLPAAAAWMADKIQRETSAGRDAHLWKAKDDR